METTDFEKIASSLTVRSICGPLGPDIELGPDYNVGDEIDHETLKSIVKMDRCTPARPSRVIQSNRCLGIVWYEVFHRTYSIQNKVFYHVSSIGEAISEEPPLAGEFLSADTNILEAIHLFSSGAQYYYILEKNDVVGVLYYSDIFKPLGRLAFLALALEIEHLALVLCSMGSLRDQCWEALSKNRQAKTRGLYKERHGHRPKKIKGKYKELEELIECTFISDKANMIWKNRLIRASSRKSVLGFFHSLEKIRNLCAHAHYKYELEEKFSPKRLGEFVETARDMKKNLVDALEENRVKEREAVSKIVADTFSLIPPPMDEES